MTTNIPSEQEVLSYFDSLSNWGRWGADDQLGTLNFLSREKVKNAIGLVKDGFTISCARTVTYEPAADNPRPSLHYMVESGEGCGFKIGEDDVLLIRTGNLLRTI